MRNVRLEDREMKRGEFGCLLEAFYYYYLIREREREKMSHTDVIQLDYLVKTEKKKKK